MHEQAIQHSLVYGHVLDGQGGSRLIARDELQQLVLQPHESLWLHWDRGTADARHWLHEASNISPFACDLLLEEATRPRRLAQADGSLLLFLRGVNLNPGADPEDMVSLRIHVSPQRLVSLRMRPLKSVHSLHEALSRGEGPRNITELMLYLAHALTEGVSTIVEELVDDLDDLEDRLEADETLRPDRQLLLALRRRAAGLRRYMAPQREVFLQMAGNPSPWQVRAEVDYWSELHNRLTRNLEELDLARERVSLLQEAEHRHVTERMNRTMYMLGIMTAFFLPLSFVTGLLGINVSGIPGAEHPWGFALVCALLLLVAGGQWLLYRLLRWL